jgi:putative tryptophan/tyrosine transport system substrate-binding protein
MRGILIGIVVALVALNAPAAAQPAAKVFRVGILSNVPPDDPQGRLLWGEFMRGMRERGYEEGRNITIEHRSSEGRYERLPELAAELVRARVDVIVVPAPQNALAAQQATRTIPIVMASSTDPVRDGLVASLARPGGNVTGLTGLVTPDIGGKRLELLKEALPRISRVAVLSNPTYPYRYLDELKASGRSLKLQLEMVEANASEEIERAFATMMAWRPQALVVVGDGVMILRRTQIIDLASRHRLPTMFQTREDVMAGGLMSYGVSGRDNFYRAASYVDRIFKGANPGDLPVERPSRFELIVNLKTAKMLGVVMPETMVYRADEVLK